MSKFHFVPLMLALAATGVQARDANYPPPPPGVQPGPPQDDGAHYGWADVLRVDPVYGVVQTSVPYQQCYNQPVIQQDRGNSTVGTILGAVVGGVLGSTIGKGDGRRAATVVGAVAGGAVGNGVSDHGGSYETTQTNCRMVNTTENQQQIVGYDVEYRYRGEIWESRMNYDPGERLRVRVSVTPAD